MLLPILLHPTNLVCHVQDSQGTKPRCTTEVMKRSVDVNKAQFKAKVIYLTRVGDKINYSCTITWLLKATRGTVQMYSVAWLRDLFTPLVPPPWLHGDLHLHIERELLGSLHPHVER